MSKYVYHYLSTFSTPGREMTVGGFLTRAVPFSGDMDEYYDLKDDIIRDLLVTSGESVEAKDLVIRSLSLVSSPSPTNEQELRAALRALLERDERNTCRHEDTHRGGAIWEVCDQCGMKWADDEGGKPEFVEPEEWVMAREALGEE